jgi:hypothetical protein
MDLVFEGFRNFGARHEGVVGVMIRAILVTGFLVFQLLLHRLRWVRMLHIVYETEEHVLNWNAFDSRWMKRVV